MGVVVKEVDVKRRVLPAHIAITLMFSVKAAIVDAAHSLDRGLLIGRARKGWWIVAYATHGGNVLYTYIAFRIGNRELKNCLLKAYERTFGSPKTLDEVKKLEEIAQALLTGKEKELGEVTLQQARFVTDQETLDKAAKLAL